MIQKPPWYESALFIGVYILVSPVFLTFGLIILISWLYMRIIQRPRLFNRVKKEWLPKNTFILFVYSDNALWKEYAEKNIIPKIEPNAVILNWSHRKNWINSNSLEVQLFKSFEWGREWIWLQNVRQGGQPYNHMAIVFKPWSKPKVLDFWKAFKDYKFGKMDQLKAVESELNNYL